MWAGRFEPSLIRLNVVKNGCFTIHNECKVSSIDITEISIDYELQRSERLMQSVLQCAFGGFLTY